MPNAHRTPPQARAGLAPVLFALAALSAPTAHAAPAPGGRGPSPRGGNEPDKVDTENLFGFTEGTDTGKKGEQEVILDTILNLSRRRAGPGPSGYAAAQTTLSYQYDPTDDLSIEPGLMLDTRRTRNVGDGPDKSAGVFDGVSLELKYQLHKRTDASPFGLALQVQPQWQRVQPDLGLGADLFTLETRLMADVRLIPDRLWFGTNLIYTPEVGRYRGSGAGDRQSTLVWSGTLTTRVSEHVFLGPELRYARAYDGAFLNDFQGQAAFLGPVIAYQVEGKGFLSLAYSGQVWGREHASDGTRRGGELSDFSRHTVRVRFGVEF